MRKAREQDAPALEAFLARHAETSMFLRSNLRQFGLSGSDDPRATSYWIEEDQSGIRAVFGLSRGQMAMCQAPGLKPEDFAAFAREISGQQLRGFTCAGEQAGPMRDALGLANADWALWDPEPLYRLALADLATSALSEGTLRPVTPADRALLEDWFFAYETELHMSPEDERAEIARNRAEGAIAGDTVRILEVDGVPVAMTATNARLPELAQVGGVFTPPELRGHGYARTAVARHMEELRAEGVITAILFASGPAASRAYEAIGFERIGSYTLALLKAPVTAGA